MLTLFSIPPETSAEKIRISRKNAINSWRRIRPKCEIILFGGDSDVARFADEAGLRHVPDVARTEYGTPLLDDVFNRARQMASGDVLMFSNCDMMYFNNLHDTIRAIPFEQYMLCGRRWDLDVPEELPLEDNQAWSAVKDAWGKVGKWHGPSGIDYFIFPKATGVQLPPFAVGRPGWDSWLIWRAHDLGIPTIDATGQLTAIHQNHDYSHLKFGAKQYSGPEMTRNFRLAGGFKNMLTLREADWVFADGRVVRTPWPRRLFSLLTPTLAYRLALACKRHVQRQARRMA